tara:strand:+ start:1964 stop:2131 length:168 start_codon:yes stop_codon:yes gene_type:complete
MYEPEVDPILDRDREIEESLDPEIVTEDVPFVDRKKRPLEIEEEAEELEDVEASL